MSNILIFEEEWIDNLYTRFDSEHDSSASSLQIVSIAIVETMAAGSPALLVKMIDGLGDLINHTYFSNDKTYSFVIGKSSENNSQYDFKLSVSNYANSVSGKPENIAIDATFLSDKWDKFLKQTHSRSWKGKRYSDIITILMDEAGVEQYEVEKTTGEFDIIQPDWTNFQLIKWLASKSVSDVDGMSAFQYGFTKEGTFFFKTTNSLNSQSPIASFFLATSNKDLDENFAFFDIKQDYAGVLPYAGFGLNHMHFDYDTKTFVTGTKKYSEIASSQLCDWSMISDEHETAERRYFGGRDVITEDMAVRNIVDNVNAVQTMMLTVNGNTNLSIGSVIELAIPPSQYSTTVINEKYSGYWLIKKATHDLDYSSKHFQTHLSVTRVGLNGVDLKGLTASTKGKNIVS